MSVRSRVNELIDSKNLEDAIKTVELRSQEITTGDLLSIYTLIQKLIENKQASEAILVLTQVRRSTVFFNNSDFCSILKNLLRIGAIDLTKTLLFSLIQNRFITDSSSSLIFIESACDINEFSSSVELISILNENKIPLNERFWESALNCFHKKDAVVHAAECFKFLRLPEIKSKRIWEDFITACIKSHQFLIAASTVQDIGLLFDKSLAAEWWNILLKIIVNNSELPSFEICKVIEKAIELNVGLNEDVLTQSMIKLVISKEEEKIVGYLKALKTSVNAFAMSKIISKLIDMNLPREALELSNLVVIGAFGPQVTVDNLELTNDKLKWILKHQQLQMIKLMRMKKIIDEQHIVYEHTEEVDEDEFVFL